MVLLEKVGSERKESKMNIIGIKKGVLLFTLFLCSLIVFPNQLYSQENIYLTENRLFHIERSKNRNLVCYDINLIDGKLANKDPLSIYWVNREDNPGEKKGLTAIQKKLAYGYKLVSQDEHSCEVSLSAYSGRNITIKRLDNNYVCTIQINNEPAILTSLYVKAKESNSLSVEYVELRGTSIKTKLPVSERIKK